MDLTKRMLILIAYLVVILDSLQTILSEEEFVKPAFCIAAPLNMSFCSTELAWAPTMAMPNLLGHKSEYELDAFLPLYPLQELTNVKCKASHQFKLLLCSVITPVCLDTNPIPCRQLCMTVKSSCEPAFKRQGLEWPKFLDCRRFPRKSQNKNCIERQPITISTTNSSRMATCVNDRQELTMKNLTRPNTKRKRKEKKNRSKIILPGKATSPPPPSSSTIAPSTTLATSNPTTSSDSSVFKDSAGSLNTTTSADIFDLMITSLDTQPSSTTEIVATISATTTAIPSPSTVSKELSMTSSSVSPIAISINLLETKAQSSNESSIMNLNIPAQEENTNSFRQDYASMPVNVTNDLTQLLCSTSPDWLIKTKLSDGQLINAVMKRKLKVRSYLQIFGATLANKDGAISTTAQPQDSRKSVRSNLNLELSNMTVFVAPLGADLYTQPISKASESNQDSTQLKSTVRYYLIAGTGTNDTTKSTSIFILWPIGKVAMNPGSQGSVNIIKTYREFKHKGLRVCNLQNRRHFGQPQQQLTNPKDDLNGNNTHELSSTNLENRSSKRYRRNKKKRVQTTMNE